MNKKEVTPVTWFEKHGIKEYDLVMSNPWKGRLCYKFINTEGTRLFLKWNDEKEEHRKHWSLLKKEEHIYHALKDLDITPLYMCGDMFITEYVDGETLRSRLKKLISQGDQNSVIKILENVLQKWKALRYAISNCPQLIENRGKAKLFSQYLTSLFVSGPINTRCNNLLSYYRNYLLLIVYRIRYKNLATHFYNKGRMTVVHGDFHANNILVDNQGNTYILDFENVQSDLPEIELAYIMAQIHLLIKENTSLLVKIDTLVDVLRLVDHKTMYYAALKVFDKAIRYNNRFA